MPQERISYSTQSPPCGRRPNRPPARMVPALGNLREILYEFAGVRGLRLRPPLLLQTVHWFPLDAKPSKKPPVGLRAP
jgi:hypothetical protein